MLNILPPFAIVDCDDSGNRLTVTASDSTVGIYNTEDFKDDTRGILTLIQPDQARRLAVALNQAADSIDADGGR